MHKEDFKKAQDGGHDLEVDYHPLFVCVLISSLTDAPANCRMFASTMEIPWQKERVPIFWIIIDVISSPP